MLRRVSWIILLAFLCLLLSACGRKVASTQGVYATAYTILTQTADVESKIPTHTSTPRPKNLILPPQIQTTPTPTPAGVQATVAQPVATNLPPANTPALQPTTRQVVPTAVPTQRLLVVPTNPPLPTNTPSTPTATKSTPTGTPAIQPPSQGLVGLWQEDLTGATFQFNADGTYRLANSYSGMVDDSIDDGQYAMQANQVLLTGGTNSISCNGLTGTYDLQTPVPAQRRFNLGQDVCHERQQVIPGKTWYWLPVKPGATPVATTAVEQPIIPITLQGPLSLPDSKINGLTWYNDHLILIPQNPTFVGDGKSYFFALSRADLVSYLNNLISGSLTPMSITLNDSNIATQLAGFQGYQAAATLGDKIYLIAQADSGSGPRSYILAGNIAADLSSITLDTTKIIEIPAQASGSSRVYKSLMVSDNNLLAIPELNGAATNPNPVAQRFDANLTVLSTISLPGLEYPVTDSEGPDANGRAWVLNKFASGDPGGLTGLDPLAQLYGEGVTHQVFDYTERLVAYQVASNSVTLAAIPPIQLELSARGPRNWQGLAPLGTQGVVLVTNQQPGTLLGYLSFP